MSDWRELPAPVGPGPSRGGAVRSAAPLAVAALLWLLGLHGAAVVVAVAGLTLLIVTVVRPLWATRVEALLATVGRGVGHGLTFVLLGIVELLVFLPLALLARLFRRDPLVGTGRPAGGGWERRSTSVVSLAPRRPFAPEEAVSRRRGLRVAFVVVRVIGWVVIALALNYGLGWLWDEWFDSHDQPVAAPVSAQTATELAVAPAMAGDDWARDYWREFRSLDYEFHPFILSRVAATDGRYIQVDGAVRRSYEPADLAADTPEVWFLGGAALWGQGQRDEHTIPSAVARLAEADGTPIRAVNLGQPGYTSWQSALLLEQELAVRPAPDLVVVYDGADDVAVQIEGSSQDPTHYNVAGVTEALTGRDSAREQAEDWWQEYRDTSAVNRLLQRVEGLVGIVEPAAAAGPGLADRVADLHARSVDLATFAASEHDVPVLFTWQAAAGVAGDGGAYRRVAGRADQGRYGAVDLSEALDDAPEPVYLDGVLTNEQGAALVADGLWALVRPALG